MTDRYRFAFGEDTVYARVLELISRFRRADGLVVADIGCGFGAIAEPVKELGLSYVGFDLEPSGLMDLEKRGFETECIDLYGLDEAMKRVSEKVGDRELAATVMLDTLEHLTNGPAVLAALQALALSRGSAPLVLGVPNVTHLDLVAKLLLGRWDMTELGLLDDTHVSFFSEDRLAQMTAAAGWTQIGAADYLLAISDQHFPADSPVLTPGTPIHELLRDVRSSASEGGSTNEFVRAYLPVRTADSYRGGNEVSVPFLSVLLRTQGTRGHTLEETLVSLAAQTCQDFEVLILPHDVPRDELGHIQYLVDCFAGEFPSRVRIVPVEGGGRSRPLNVGVERARGTYIAILDDDDVAMAHWVESFKESARRAPGRVLRSVPAEQDVRQTVWTGPRQGYEIAGRPRCPWAPTFQLIEHLSENHSPPCSYALPRRAFVDMGVEFDESLPVLEDWDVLLRTASLCGVIDSGEVTALWRKWQTGDCSTTVHSELEWSRARATVLAKVNARPLILPEHTADDVRDLYERARGLRAQVDALGRARAESERALADANAKVNELVQSTSWRVTKPLRMISGLFRRALRA